MTVSYTGDVANASAFGCFSKILLRWRGSVYKLVFKELLAYTVMYMIINLTYRTVLIRYSEDCDQTLPSCERWRSRRELFESFRMYVNHSLKTIPLTFVLGFYVSLVLKRWWLQYNTLPWPDSFAIMLVGAFKVENDDKGRMIRRNLIRYVTLAYCIALRTVSFRLKKRFPTLEHLVHAGIMRPDEFKLYHILDQCLTKFQKLDEKVVANKWFLPLVWCAKMIGEGVENGNIEAPNGATVMDEIGKIRQKLTTILTYDWISVPLVYTQVVTLAVYFYFIGALFGSQWVSPATDEASTMIYKTSGRLDLFYPFFLSLQFAFFIGWLKVAETLINPFGEDDDDFELNRLIDRHLQVGFLICDPTAEKPDLLKDKYWDDTIPNEMLYTVGSIGERDVEFQGSAEITLNVDQSERLYSDLSVPNPLRKRVNSNETIYESIRSRNFTSKPRKLSNLSNLLWKKKERPSSRKSSRSSDPGRLQVLPALVLRPALPALNSSPSLPAQNRHRPELPELISVPSKDSGFNLSDIEMRETYSIV
ncbi:bestrophin-4 [Eurytemora carolleeae]|uniref:bestrophin-4 n=1 Tax=Eurytemora carolleeae TaxID=1294199 RepID=UPI000C77D370|nr:bestrophin-4 [Eurytemora carolleeae]|eukprot:XP_023341651.1 bestrophin-4-like [Eurytemora affinis]